MEEGTFMTGVEIFGGLNANRNADKNFHKAQSGSQTARAPVASGRNLHSRNDSLPQLNSARELATAKPSLRHSMSESNFKKPLFKKLAIVRDIYDKQKSATDEQRAKSSLMIRKQNSARQSKENYIDPKSYTHADAFNVKIVQRFDELYSKKKNAESPATADPLTKRKHFFQELDKQETRLQGDLKKFNDIFYEIGRKEKILATLQFQCDELSKKLEDTKLLEGRKVDREQQLVEWGDKIEVEEHKNECLKHMKQLKKEFLLGIKKYYVKTKEEYDEYLASIDYLLRNAEYDKNLYVKNRLHVKDFKKKSVRDNLIGPQFEDMLEEEISEFEGRRNLREIFKHERVIEEELRKQDEEDVRRSVIEKQNRQKEEDGRRQQKEAEHEKELNRIKRQYHELQKVTHVTKKEELNDYFDGLIERSAMLQKEIDVLDNDLKQDKELLIEMKHQIKAKKFEETSEAPKDEYPTDIRLDDLEIILRDKLNEVTDRENNMKRLEKLSYEVCTVVSRILKQLQKTKTPMSIDKANVVDLLSICGLKLERMLTVVIKKKKTFFIESINTDGTIKEGPPVYMNIVSDDLYNKSKKRYERDDKTMGILEELSDDDFDNLRNQIKERDELESIN